MYVHNGHLWEPVTLNLVAEPLAVERSLPVFTTQVCRCWDLKFSGKAIIWLEAKIGTTILFCWNQTMCSENSICPYFQFYFNIGELLANFQVILSTKHTTKLVSRELTFGIQLWIIKTTSNGRQKWYSKIHVYLWL